MTPPRDPRRKIERQIVTANGLTFTALTPWEPLEIAALRRRRAANNRNGTSALGEEVYFALAMEWRVSRRYQPFTRRPLYVRSAQLLHTRRDEE